MEIKFKVESLGEVVYNENAWGRQGIKIDGIDCQKIQKKTFLYKTEEKERQIFIQGSFLIGIKVLIDGGIVYKQGGPKWYEWILALLPLAFVLIWPNVPMLQRIIPVVGGAVGGAIGGVMAAVSLIVMRLVDKAVYKILIGIIFFCATVGITIAVALLVVSIMFA